MYWGGAVASPFILFGKLETRVGSVSAEHSKSRSLDRGRLSARKFHYVNLRSNAPAPSG
jgi:hypothetical protein